MKHYDAALVNIDIAINLNPFYAEAYSNRGIVFNELNRFDDAIKNIDHALLLKPNYAETYLIRGLVLKELKQFEKALKSYDQALTLNPDINFLHGQRLFTRMEVCNWAKRSNLLNQLTNKLISHQTASDPFSILALIDNPDIHRKTAETYVKSECPSNNILPAIIPYPSHTKIRIGYFSADFKNHPVAFLTHLRRQHR